MRLTAEETVARLRRAGYTTSRGNTVGWYQRATECGGDFSRTRLLCRRRAGRHRICQRQNCAHRFLAGPHRAESLRPRAATHRESLGPARKAAAGAVQRHSAVAGARGDLRRGQALLPPFRLRHVPHDEGGIRRPEGRPQGTGRVDPLDATRARLLAGPRKELAAQDRGSADHHAARRASSASSRSSSITPTRSISDATARSA